MLVLSRRENQSIDIAGGFSAGGITVCVIEIREETVRIGIDAPKEVTIHRREVQILVDANNANQEATEP